MSFEQKRNAERLPLDEPLEGSVGGIAAKIVEVSAIGCRLEHQEKMSLGASTTLRFKWRDRSIEVRAKVARTQLKSAYPNGLYYETGLKFADALDDAPPEIRDLLAEMAEPSVPPPVAHKIAVPEPPPVELPPVEVPPLVVPPPTTPGDDTMRRLRRSTERVSSLPLEAFAPVEPEYDLDALDWDDPPDVASNPFATQAEAVALAVESPPEPELEPEPEPAEPLTEYVECSLENGAWKRRIVTSLLQPAEGFITLPAEDRELDMLCKSYEYADPETRRLIRISLELAATQKKD